METSRSPAVGEPPQVGSAEQSLFISVDRDLCEGNAVCIGIAPEMFDLDDDDFAIVIDNPVSDSRRDVVDQVMNECPRAAIRQFPSHSPFRQAGT